MDVVFALAAGIGLIVAVFLGIVAMLWVFQHD